MKHVVLGLGNLGFDLAKAITTKGHKAVCMSRGNKVHPFNYPETGIDMVLDEKPDVVWCCVGAGSIEQANKNFQPFVDLHVNLPLDLIQQLPKSCRIILFSTDYVANERRPADPSISIRDPKSLYALSKLWMEQMVREMRSVNVRVCRVTSLYGSFKPSTCFPGKVLLNKPESLPVNFVTPTATYWLADYLVHHMDTIFAKWGPVHHVAPRGFVRLCDWGMEITGRPIIASPADLNRPLMSDLGCSVQMDYPHWKSVWNDPRNIFLRQKPDQIMKKNNTAGVNSPAVSKIEVSRITLF